MKHNRPPKVFIAGGVSLDTVIHLNELPPPVPSTVYARESYQTVGGTSAGKALNLRGLGCEVTVAAQFGPDSAGQVVRDSLKRAGVHLLEIPDQQTEQHTNLMDAQGERLSIFTVMRTFEPSIDIEEFRSSVSAADVVMLDIINWSRQLIPLVKEYQKPLWCDLHDYDGQNPYHQDYLDAADVIFLSSQAMSDWPGFMRDQVQCGKEMVVVTHGAMGAGVLTASGEAFSVPAVPHVVVVDTNGAGDAFLGGFCCSWWHGGTTEQNMEAGSQVAALCVQSRELAAPDLKPSIIVKNSV